MTTRKIRRIMAIEKWSIRKASGVHDWSGGKRSVRIEQKWDGGESKGLSQKCVHNVHNVKKKKEKSMDEKYQKDPSFSGHRAFCLATIISSYIENEQDTERMNLPRTATKKK